MMERVRRTAKGKNHRMSQNRERAFQFDMFLCNAAKVLVPSSRHVCIMATWTLRFHYVLAVRTRGLRACVEQRERRSG